MNKETEAKESRVMMNMDDEVKKCLDEMVGFQLRFTPEEFFSRFPQIGQAVMAFERRGYAINFRPERKAGWGSRRRTEPAYIEVSPR